MSNLPTLPDTSTLALLRTKLTAQDRAKLQAAVLEPVEDPYFHQPVPRFLTELPRGGDADAMTDQIAAQILVAPDPEAAQADAGTVALKDLVGKPITIWDIRVLDGDKPGGWGAFLLIDFTRGESDLHEVGNTGAKQVVTRLARAWADGDLPVSGVVTQIAGTGKRGEPALAFLAETAL